MEGEWIDRGRLWKERVRAIQLQIRDRFRVVVDKHRHWPPAFSNTSVGYHPPTIQRWIHRARSFFGESSPSTVTYVSTRSSASITSRFYRKRVGKEIAESEDSMSIHWLQALAVPVLGNACHAFMHGLNCIQIYGAEKLHKVLLERPEGKPLVTVSNHVAAVDDPFVIASLLPPSVMLDARNVRWTLCATDRCFSNPMFSAFFRCVKVLPVSRGDGIYQKGMDMALSKLNNGGWVHIFPEGSRSRDGGRTLGAAKRGVGRLVMDADKMPIVVPFVHTGMQEIMPVGTHFPKIGKSVTVVVGDPIDFEDLLLPDVSDTQVSRGILYDAVSSRITQRLHELKLEVDRLVVEQTLELQNSYLSNANRASGIWQQVDWEAFGLEGPAEECSRRSPFLASETSFRADLHQQPTTTDKSLKIDFSHEGGIASRIRGYMNPSDLMGFAARGLFMNIRTSSIEYSTKFQDVKPLKVWRQLFLETNVLHKLNAV